MNAPHASIRSLSTGVGALALTPVPGGGLAAWQHDFQAWLVDASDDAARRFGDHAAAGLAVYQNNYRSQLVECLEQSYPQVRTWIGDDAFLHAAITHINSRPPHAWTLDVYGCDFADTLAALYPDNPDLHELAWIENALTEAFVARDAEPLPADSLATIDWDTARLRFTPSLATIVATTNADAIWSALSTGETPPDGEMLADPGGLIVWRRRFTSCLNRLDALDYDALRLAQTGGRFADLCDMLVARLGEADGVAKAGALLAGWFGSEWVVGIEQD